MANAFYGSNARQVYVPTKIKSIWNYAFSGCALTEIYFTHNIFVESKAFLDSADNFIIHCPRDCHDRAFWYFRTNAVIYGANWEEWNG